ncbi:MAG: hypothetical protein QW103_01395 [Candidatus Pacearchaeota archaeon]
MSEQKSKIRIIEEYEIPYIGNAKLVETTIYDNFAKREYNNYSLYINDKQSDLIKGSKNKEDAIRKLSEGLILHLLKKKKELLDETNKVSNLLDNIFLLTRDLNMPYNWVNHYSKSQDLTKFGEKQ